MVKTMGENSTQNLLKNAIFSVTIGSNDIITYFLPNLPFVGNYDVSPTTLQDLMVSKMTSHLKVPISFTSTCLFVYDMVAEIGGPGC